MIKRKPNHEPKALTSNYLLLRETNRNGRTHPNPK